MTTILAIDDDKHTLSIITTLLPHAIPHTRIITALSGREGIEKARRENPDVILLDLVMPGIDGFETCSILKNDAALKWIPVIILTGAKIDTDCRTLALHLGADAFLTKPFHEAEFIAQVSAMLRIKRSEDKVRQENLHLEGLVQDRTRELEESAIAALNLMEDLKAEIDEHRESEVALRESEERYRAVANFTYDWEYWLAPDGTFIYVSPSVKRITGYRADEFLCDAKLMEKLVHPDDKERTAAHNHPAGKDGDGPERHDTDFPILTKSGKKRWIAHVCRKVYSENGEYMGRRGSNRDITKRKQAEDALRESETRYRSLFENAVEGIFQSTPEGTCIAANPALAKLFGYDSPEEFIKHTTDIARQYYLRPEDRETYINILETAGVIKGFEVQLINKEGHPLWASISSRVVRDAQDNVLYYEGTMENITARKEAEVQIGTSLREKEVLLKEIHHRVKNNLQVISSLLSIQSTYIKDPKALDMFRESIYRIRTMAHIHETLYRSKDYGQINFCGYIDELSSQLYSSYGLTPESVTLTTDVANIFLDLNTAIPLGLIINELASNAMKHAFPDGRKGEILISLRTEEERIVLSVSDNGIGFPSHIDFEKTDSLGLQLVMELTEQIEGKIELIQQGATTFVLTLPRALDA